MAKRLTPQNHSTNVHLHVKVLSSAARWYALIYLKCSLLAKPLLVDIWFENGEIMGLL